MAEGTKSATTELPLASVLVKIITERVYLETKWEHPIPSFWPQLMPMVTIFNNNILLASFIHDTVDIIKMYIRFQCLYRAYIIITLTYKETYWDRWRKQ